MRWFGPAPFSAICEDVEIAHVPTPVGAPCQWCAEPIEPGACGYFYSGADPSPVHYECFIRQVCGSVGHQLRRCSCYGGGEGDGDPPGLSRREAARRALQVLDAQRPGI